MTMHIGVLTAGGDSPGLNAVLRGIGKAAREHFNMEISGDNGRFVRIRYGTRNSHGGCRSLAQYCSQPPPHRFGGDHGAQGRR
jgi:hypothetical protein